MTSAPHRSNKDTVLAFYERAINNKDFEAATELIGPRYIQHNPRIADGIVDCAPVRCCYRPLPAPASLCSTAVRVARLGSRA